MSVRLMLRRSLPGSGRAVRDHIRRGDQIVQVIEARWGVDHPHQWKMKHVRWYLDVGTAELATSTRYDHWRTVRALLASMGRLRDWEPRLRGPWCHRSGQAGRGAGGRPPKLPHRAIRRREV
jgi:hypothetical protein